MPRSADASRLRLLCDSTTGLCVLCVSRNRNAENAENAESGRLCLPHVSRLFLLGWFFVFLFLDGFKGLANLQAVEHGTHHLAGDGILRFGSSGPRDIDADDLAVEVAQRAAAIGRLEDRVVLENDRELKRGGR